MSKTHDEIRAVRVMVDELRAEPPPELPWDAMEQRLLARMDQDAPAGVGSVHALHASHASHASHAPRRGWGNSPLSRVLGYVAVAAALIIGVASVVRNATPGAPHRVDVAAVATAPGEAGKRGERDLRSLRVGDVIESKATPVTFARDGLVAWTLQPGSAVRVRSMGDDRSGVGHTVTLERGEIRAEVTPRAASEGIVEAFAVEIQGTRVAVRGTAFSVALEVDHVIVDVVHGSIAVGAIGQVGLTTGHLLVGPARASFSLDGGRTTSALTRPTVTMGEPPPQPAQPVLAATEPARLPDPAAPVAVVDTNHAPSVARGAAHPAAPVAAPEPVAVAPQAEPPAPPVAAPEAPQLTVALIRGRLDRCFRSTHEVGSSAVEMSVSSMLRLQLNADGTVRSARFDPPLKPEFVSCAGGAIAGRFAEGSSNVDIPVTFKP